MRTPIARLIDRWNHRQRSRSVKVVVDDEGVSVVDGNGTILQQFRWADVIEIRTFKLDLGTVDDIRLSFETADLCNDFSEDIEGFRQLSDRMLAVFPTIPRDWYGAVMQPPFATNDRVLFRRSETRAPAMESPPRVGPAGESLLREDQACDIESRSWLR